MKKIWMPSIEIETAHGCREVSLLTDQLLKKKIFLTGEIDEELANDFLLQMMYLKEENSNDPVTIYINSPGGEVTSGLMIYDIIQKSSLDIRIICVGQAASMGALILAGGPKGKRFILPHSKVMIHEPLMRSGVGGSASSIRNLSESIMGTRDVLSSILAEHTGRSIDEINTATSYDHIMDATEAIDFGICDEIITSI